MRKPRLARCYNKTDEVLAIYDSEGLQLLRNKLQDPLIKESTIELLHA